VSTVEPGANVPELADPDRRFFAWRAKHPNVAEDPRAVWAEAWRQGAWAGINENRGLGLLLLQLKQQVTSLEQRVCDLQAGADVEREIERVSAYWRTEAEDAPRSQCELDPEHEYHQHEVHARD
jgi:hypothetical protein